MCYWWYSLPKAFVVSKKFTPTEVVEVKGVVAPGWVDAIEGRAKIGDRSSAGEVVEWVEEAR